MDVASQKMLLPLLVLSDSTENKQTNSTQMERHKTFILFLLSKIKDQTAS